jgi:hypothetical protein
VRGCSRIRRRAGAFAKAGPVLAAAIALGTAPAGAQRGDTVAAVLQGLDKTTARVSRIEAPVDGVARFGTLEIVARACHKKPPTETPESAAFLDIVDVRPDSPSIRVFNGWMFASSPALSAMEHPVYDIWVVDCRQVAPVDEEEAALPAEDAVPDTAEAPETAEVPEAPPVE